MTKLLYVLGIGCYGMAIHLAAIFHGKARAWVQGRQHWRQHLKEAMPSDKRHRIWFHCASLGEFEQGRPVLEQIRKEFPGHFILLSFFSPSGYEAKKNDPLADHVCYLPLDGARSSRQFVEIVSPSLVFFVKYEFWYFYGKFLHERKIPFFCLSAIFRPGQIFFKPWGVFFRKILTRYSHLFVQDQASLELLYKNRIPSVTVSGDTRFDRVMENSRRKADFPLIEQFTSGQLTLVAGSTWPEDEKVLAALMKEVPTLKMIIAPHELGESRLRKLESRFEGKALRYSQLGSSPGQQASVLIIDSIGMLSLLYRYGKYAYLGGGFGSGIHNILEAAVYGKPVFFGPHFNKFREARDLKAMGGGIPVKNAAALLQAFDRLENDPEQYRLLCQKNQKYIEDRKGATEILMNYLRINFVNF
ncbi:MAG: 3-deoxy-D-manno-octulosonic acid transferase [Bacteroidia bacterium]|nr:3-deoxy-D-manno-octulosonic acid transferase [Bacteroidia bacterium]